MHEISYVNSFRLVPSDGNEEIFIKFYTTYPEISTEDYLMTGVNEAEIGGIIMTPSTARSLYEALAKALTNIKSEGDVGDESENR